MSNVTEFKTIKRRQNRRRMARAILLIAAVLVGTYLLSLMVNSPKFAGASSIKDMLKGGPGFPIEAPGGKIRGMYENESSIAVLNETTLYFYNTSGSDVYSAQHRMGNPQVKTQGTMLLNYDRGAKTYGVYSRTTPLYEGKTDQAIRCADISQNGTIALATQGENAQTQVRVLDEKQQEKYLWKSSNTVTALALSEHGNMLAVGASYVENGALKNTLTVLKDGRELFKTVLDNEMILALEFSGNQLRCVTDRSAKLFAEDGQVLGQFGYKNQILAGFAMGDNGLALMFGSYEKDRQYVLASIANDFYTLNGTAMVKDHLQKIAYYGQNILVLGTSSLNQYSAYDCRLLDTSAKEDNHTAYYEILPLGQSIYAATPTEIVRLPMREPSRFSAFGENAPQKMPNEQDLETQKELDLIEELFSEHKPKQESQQKPEKPAPEQKPEEKPTEPAPEQPPEEKPAQTPPPEQKPEEPKPEQDKKPSSSRRPAADQPEQNPEPPKQPEEPEPKLEQPPAEKKPSGFRRPA